ncbi:prefoldin subunit 4-like [Ruditapes philippinarum]|uniref:prefoldin subunit 4-like n=1 Tax=Ruditapes philippinarum TaxID=129788 RepID=UPI00295B0BE2|nr:prefoldin subunit 4-like [Ruditapes philippinarum]
MATTIKDMDADAQVTFEDQQKINKFARNNSKLQDIKEELKAKKKELENLEFAEEELMMLESDDSLIPYQVGEVFISVDSDETNSMLEKAKQATREHMETLEKRATEHKKTLQDLKVQLYAKFGTNINLEEEED